MPITLSMEDGATLELGGMSEFIGSAYAPQIAITDTDTGHEVAITYMSPEGIVTERFDVADGETGPQGPAGFSPTVTITDTATGHTVTITDADGPHSYFVPNYADEEQQRQDAWDELSGEVTDAITAAESATSAASTAAQSATSAATSATSAAQEATTAAASANTAVSAATSAATAANSAATAADTAADAATTAASSATDAASAANTAAQAAQEAATEVAPEVAWLWGNQLKSSLSGELMQASDAYGAPALSLGVNGKSTQVVTTGKNLFTRDGESTGYINGAGTAVGGNGWMRSTHLPITGGLTYTFNPNSAAGASAKCAFYDTNKDVISGAVFASGLNTFDAPNDAEWIRVSYRRDESFDIQLALGSSPTSYEPYSCGKPSPSPDYPQPIASFGPRNILPRTVYHLAENVRAVEGSAYRSMYCEVDPNTTYTVSRARVLGNRFGVYTTTVEPAAGVALTTIKRPDTDTGILSYTFTTAADAAYVFFYLANNDADVSDSDMQLEKGSVAHPYLPYGCSLALLFAGKNLLDAANPAVSGAATYTYENDTLTVTAASANTWCYLRYRVSAVEWMQGQSVTLSTIASATSTPYFGIEFYRADGSRISYAVSNTQAITRTVPYETSYISVLFYARNTQAGAVGDTATYRNIQLELGSTATAYEPCIGVTASIDLGEHRPRSLPDGTRDTLALTYLRPSTREGWAWYDRELTALVGETTTAATDGVTGTVGVDVMSTTGEIADGPTVLYKLATPITTQLDPIELPILPAPNCTVLSDPTTGLQMEYVQDTNIVIASLQAALADLATS